MQLSKNQSNFSIFFPPFLKSASNFKHLEKKMTFIAYVFPELHTRKDLVRPMSKKCPFTTPFNSQYVKRFQTLVKSA